MIESDLRVEFFYGDREPAEVLDGLASRLGSREGVSHTGTSDTVGTEAGTFSLHEHTGSHRYDDVYEGGYLAVRMQCMQLLRETNRQLLSDFFRLSKEIYRLTEPQYACGLHSRQVGLLGYQTPLPVSEEGLAANRIDRPMWLMIFPPAMVAEYGREWLLDLPAERTEELDDGAVMTVATTDFLDADESADPDAEITNRIERAIDPLKDAFAERH